MGFNWQQTIIHNPANPTGSTLKPNSPGPLILSGNVAYLGMTLPPLNPLGRCLSSVLWTGCSLTAGPSPAYYDPPSGGYTYMNNDPYPNPYPFLIPSQVIYAGSRACNVAPLCPIFPYAESDDGTTLSMVDTPADSNLSGETPTTTPFRNFEAFQTTLVGVSTQAIPGSAGCGPGSTLYCTSLYSWNWNSTFNGNAGEGGVSITQSANIYPVIPGSGTGGVTITSINGVLQAPPSVSCTANPNTLWPPNGKSVVVTVSGGSPPVPKPLPALRMP